MDKRLNFPHRITPEECFYKPRRPGLDVGAVSGTFAGMRLASSSSEKRNEKALMHGLNDRLAGFIEKVHRLEYQNHLLEREIEEIKGRAKPASCLEEEYGPELRKLRQLLQDITHQKHQIEIEHQNLEEDLSNLGKQYEQEARSRAEVDSNITVFKKDIDDAYQAKLQLEKKAQALVDEIQFLKTHHEAEVSQMFDQIQNAHVTVTAHEFGNPGITAALRDIRAQLEGHAASPAQQVGETFRSQFAKLTEAAETKREALKVTQREIQEYRRRLQAKSTELDCAKGTREALEKQLHHVEDRHNEEVMHYQNTIKELENELINCKFDMSGYLREYQDLLNVKMALDVEILSYRKLLCGEEARLSAVSDTQISLPYIYHQSPVYTLPCLSRPGGPHRRVEPQYKFVEEIITETTREIEMSEFEETGSEGTEVEKDEQECTKSSKRSSEEEDHNKDSREEEGEQMSDSQQNQAETVNNALIKVADEMGPVEAKDGEQASEKTEAADKEESGMDKNTPNKVLLSDSRDEEEKEPHQKATENTEDGKESVATKVTAQKDPTSKPADLTPHPEISENDKEGDAEKESFSSVVVKETVHESHQSDKTQQELSNTVQVPDEVQTLVSETAEKPADFKAEATVSVDEEKAQVISAAAKSEEKEHSMQAKSEAAKDGDKEAITLQHEGNKSQDREPSFKSNEKNGLQAKDHMSDSKDKTEMTSTVLPKNKTMGSAEVNQLPQGAPENKKGTEESKYIRDPQDKLLKQESSKSEI